MRLQTLVHALCLTAAFPLSAQTLSVLPAAEVVAGSPLHLSIAGARAGERLSLRASRLGTGEPARRFESRAEFEADGQGRVDLDRQAPVAGSYAGADPRGLFWAMQPVAADAARPALDPDRPGEVLLELIQGEKTLQTLRLRLLPQAADVVVTQPAEFPGARFATQGGAAQGGAARRPALIVLGGSEGGSSAARSSAPLLASQGYAVLGLPYYSPPSWTAKGPVPPELPALPDSFVDIELSRLEQARDWLARQPGVDASRIGVYGVSKGAEFALAAASRMPWIKAVAAIVPSDVIWEGWGAQAPEAGQRSSFAWKGQALPFVPYQDFAAEFAGAGRGEAIHIRRPLDKGRAAHPERLAAARIEVEKIEAPVFLVGGGDDQVWDSAGMAQAIAAQRAAFKRPTVSLIYPQAGHALSGHGWSPTTVYNEGLMKFGGQPEADARAQGEAWPRLLDFLREALSR